MRTGFGLLTLAALMFALPARAAPDWNAVGEALGKQGSLQGGVYRVALPRTDLNVTLDGIEVKPALGLGSWVAFQPIGRDAMVMGDLVLTGDEVNPVMKKLAESGVEITALHNHLLRSRPATMYMHVAGHGDPVELARALHEALALSHTPMGLSGAAAAQPPLEMDTAALERALGFKGKANAGVYQFSIMRADPVRDGSMPIPEAMGSSIVINFQPTEAGKAAITGDFPLTAEEVNPVLRALRANGIEVTALHSHMLTEEPRLFFMHFWANDDAVELAHGLRAALDHVKIARNN